MNVRAHLEPSSKFDTPFTSVHPAAPKRLKRPRVPTTYTGPAGAGLRLERADGCAYTGAVAAFEWDPDKAAANSRKHGIEFADAVGVFEDERAITIEDTSTDEERFKTLGCDFLGRLLVVAYTYRHDRIRLISARKATVKQRDLYDRKRR